MSGLIHIYCGDGKGKTTAATGLAVRAAGAGKNVLFVQFSKSGNSSEIKILESVNNITVCTALDHHGLLQDLSEEERDKTCCSYMRLFHDVCTKAQNNIDLLVLDEVISACNYQVIEESSLITFLKTNPSALEIVLTGREPSNDLLALADYITEMKKIRHPYDKGTEARKGIEF